MLASIASIVDEFDASSLSILLVRKNLEELSRGGSWADTNENSRVTYRSNPRWIIAAI